MKKNYPITGKEKSYDSGANILSTTTPKGMITYINEDFIDISGFEETELINANHNIVRHPEMPPAAFEDLWSNLKAGNSWMGMVKNRCKDGDHYWVHAYATPIVNNGQTTEYQSVRIKPDADDVKRAEQLYAKLNKGIIPRSIRTSAPKLLTKLIGGFSLSLFIALGLTSLFFSLDLTAAAAVFLLGTSLFAIVSYATTKPLQEAVAKARSITSNPIARQVYTGRNDEAADLMLAMKMLDSEASAIIGRIADSAKHLTDKAEALLKNAERTKQGNTQQFSETDQVATAINEMTATIQEVARNTQRTADEAGLASNEVHNGKNLVNNTMLTIKNLVKEVEQATDVIRSVEADSHNISGILDVIRNVSEQTNLLALNAAIEAARAGEHGRGFAVVADEVRTLANRTREATVEIQATIEKLQASSQGAVSVMELSRNHVNESVKQTDQVVDSLDNITNIVNNIHDMSTQIATAVEEQSAVSEEINRSVVTIRDIAEETLNQANIGENESGEMAELSQRLKNLAKQFWDKRKNG
ncbi:MAG TPA: PAS domain-containing methyl-accepting chemotaxis protein [Gammaproteobacteria bacterium]